MKVEAVTPLSSIINITYKGENLEKIKTFLNKYLDFYLNANLEKKNKASVNTIQFIDSQISQISDSLNSSESKLRDYRSANQVTDLSFQGQRLYDQLTQLETQMTALEMQRRYYNYVIEYLNKNKDVANIVPPSSMNVNDPVMNQYISDLIALNSERAAIINTSSKKNLFLGQIENKIRAQKDAILENVQNNLNTLVLSLNELKYRYSKQTGEISKLPRTETRLVGIERKFKLNDAIYTFLLQKRAEAEIERASNTPDYEVLNPARPITATIVSPKKTINLFIAFFLGLLIPSIGILLKDFFNDKVQSASEIEALSQHKVIGVILKNKHKSEAIVAERPRSSVAESFRKLRTNLLIRPMSTSAKSILVTSSMPYEGKSFVSFNLAASIASIGYKTLIIDFDLRKPVLHNKFNIDNSIGLSHYLVNKASVDDIIVKTFVPNLFFMPAGVLLPNPSELIEAGACDKLFNYLKANFNFLIIDTPPLGAVTDSYLLMKYATQVLLVARQNYSNKEVVSDVIKGLSVNNLNNYEIVLNDVNYKKNNYSTYYDEERIVKKAQVNHSSKPLHTYK
jgi:capsular exopolysaccharide synthesis family protein